MLNANHSSPVSHDASALSSLFSFDYAHDQIAASDKRNEIELRERSILDALASTVDQRQADSRSYRLHGQDSWSWGNPGEWIKIGWFRALLGPNKEAILEQYPILEKIVDELHANGLDNYYELRNASEVHAYVNKHPQLLEFLLESYQQLRRYFGSESSFGLEVVHDPEINRPNDFLFVYIRTSLDVDEAMGRLDRFDDDWYLDQIDSFGALVNFNLEIYEL